MSNCDVCIGGNVEEFYEDYDRQARTAESSITCEECREQIPAGSQYELASGIYFDKRHEHITCLSCVEIRDVFSCGESVTHGSLWEDMRDYAFPDLTTASECFTELSAVNKARVLKAWREWKGLPV